METTTSNYQNDTTMATDVTETYFEALDQNSSGCFNYDNDPASVIIQISLAIVIIALNAFVIGLIVYNSAKTFRKPTFIFIIAFSSTDMLLALSLIVFSWIIVGNYQFEASTWVSLQALTSVSFNASVNFLLVIALDRLLFIAYNAKYQNLMKKKSVAILIILCWLVGIIPVLPLAGGVGSCAKLCVCRKDTFLVCPDPSCSQVITGFTKGFLFGLFFYFLVMVILITGAYGRLFLKVHEQGKKVSSHSNEKVSRRMQREFRLARTIGMVIVIFIVCWSPLMLLYVIDFSSDLFLDKSITQYISTPAILNSVMNPIIYAARIPILKKFFCSCMNKPTTVDSSETSATSRVNGRFGKNSQKKKSDDNSQKTANRKNNNDETCSISRPLSTANNNTINEIEEKNKIVLCTLRSTEFERLNDDVSIATHDRCSFIEPPPPTPEVEC